jgi:hypothetical protein
MARVKWLDDDNTSTLDSRVERLAHFAKSLEDGVVDTEELNQQEKNLIAAMKAVEGSLDDETHARVTNLLVELTAYNVMNVLHGLAAERVRASFG